MAYAHNECPACSNIKGNTVDEYDVYTCAGCGGIFNNTGIWAGRSYEYVKPAFSRVEVPPERTRYYDFTIIVGTDYGPKLDRRHGWYDPETKLVTQVG